MYDVIVVGAGPAGTAAAKRCAEHGLNTLILEKRSLLRDKVCSGMVMGPSRHMMGSTNVLYGGMPATKMTSMTGQNGLSLNAPGMTLVPAQFKVILMR